MRIADKLFLNRYQPDSRTHLVIKDREVCLKNCEAKYCTYICPAGIYSWDAEEEKILVAYEGCVECGTCRYGCIFDNIDWKNPRGGFGIMYKFG